MKRNDLQSSVPSPPCAAGVGEGEMKRKVTVTDSTVTVTGSTVDIELVNVCDTRTLFWKIWIFEVKMEKVMFKGAETSLTVVNERISILELGTSGEGKECSKFVNFSVFVV